MTTRSQSEIERWNSLLERNFYSPSKGTAKEMLCNYICSLVLGRDFGEDTDAYFERKGLTEFYNWAIRKLNPKGN